MITAREIAAWRVVAPWSSDLQVDQDYLLPDASITDVWPQFGIAMAVEPIRCPAGIQWSAGRCRAAGRLHRPASPG